MSDAQTRNFSATTLPTVPMVVGTTIVTITPGKYTVRGNDEGWPAPPAEKSTSLMSIQTAANYYFDMSVALSGSPEQLPIAPFLMEVEVVERIEAFPHDASGQFGGYQMPPMQQVAPPAPYAVSPYPMGLLMSQTQQFAPPTSFPGQTNWQQMDLAAPAQVGHNVSAMRAIERPARAIHAHTVHGPVPSHLSSVQTATRSAPIDLTGDDDEAGPSTPAPRRAGTKRARAESTSDAAAPKVKKAKKEKKVKQPRIPRSGLREQPVVAATIPASANIAPVQRETVSAVEQQQHQYSSAVVPKTPSTAADSTFSADARAAAANLHAVGMDDLTRDLMGAFELA